MVKELVRQEIYVHVIQDIMDHHVKLEYSIVQLELIVIAEDNVLLIMSANVIQDLVELVVKHQMHLIVLH